MGEKKGLAVIYDPHNLYQFLWYYCNRGAGRKWDALCLPNGSKGEYMHSFCESAGVFDRIITSDNNFDALPALKKVSMVFGMFFHFITGRRAAYCRKMLNRYVVLDDYDELVVIADVGIVSGACVALGKEKDVIILEDGISDYGKRPKFIGRVKFFSLYSWQGYFLSLMGYCSPGWFYLRTDRNCIKYCSQPDKMQYTGYREIRQLYEEEGTDWTQFRQILSTVYPKLNSFDFDHVDTVLLTRPLGDYVSSPEKYNKRIEQYVTENCGVLLIKKHPREQIAYEFGPNVSCTEIDSSVPAEALLPYLKGKDILIVTTSAVMLYLKAHGLKCKMILLDGLYEESLTSNSMFRALSMKAAQEFGERYCSDCFETVVL
ncbi:MAG: alpha-2,8-polysialyltransferase family protein [Lachnospiraceae bacterium]|nr:alpha-2,8-polysialyltransferase family protein [Lachnospiraceae bacterium]